MPTKKEQVEQELTKTWVKDKTGKGFRHGDMPGVILEVTQKGLTITLENRPDYSGGRDT